MGDFFQWAKDAGIAGQILDGINYQDEHYGVVGISGQGLIHPRALGVTKLIGAYNCWRGYHNKYVIEDEQLILVEIEVSSRETMPIQGIVPVTDGAVHKFSAVYRGLHLPVDLTGGILGGKDVVGSMVVNTGFQKPHTFDTLLEFQFEQGTLMAVNDHSARMAALRQQIQAEEQAWEVIHQSELDEIARLQDVMATIQAKIDVLFRAFSNDPASTGLTAEEVKAKSNEIHVQKIPVMNQMTKISSAIYPSKRAKDKRIELWIADSFPPDYRL